MPRRADPGDHTRIDALRRAMEDLDRRITRQVQSLEVAEPLDAAFVSDVQVRMAELRDQRSTRLAELDQAEIALAATPTEPAVELLDALPVGMVDFAAMPPALARRLFEMFRLQVHYNRHIHRRRLQITIAPGAIDRLTHTARLAMGQTGDHTDKDGVPIYKVPPARPTEHPSGPPNAPPRPTVAS